LLRLREEITLNSKSLQAQHAKEFARLEADLREQVQITERAEARAKKAEDLLRDMDERCAKFVDVARLESNLREQAHTNDRIEARAKKGRKPGNCYGRVS
jgi:hypothetical protein